MLRNASDLRLVLLVLALTATSLAAQTNESRLFTVLASDFWTWRAIHQPLAGDDIPRIDRPEGWLPDWSRETMAARQNALRGFQERWSGIDTTGWTISRQVDYRLIGSAIARVEWELNVNPQWRRNPLFYIDQTLGSIFDRLLTPPPIGPARARAIVERLRRIPRTVEEAKQNLDQPIGPFTEVTIAELRQTPEHLRTFARELAPFVEPSVAREVRAQAETAIRALESYRAWLEERLPRTPRETAVGPDNYDWFLRHVALVPYSADELVAMARQEWHRSVAFEAYERRRNAGRPELAIFPTADAQIEREARDELAIRRLLEERGILTVPEWLRHYVNQLVPPYLVPLANMGVTDDLTGPNRLDENGVSYIWPPSPDLSYFRLSTAKDPRPIIVHEGVPGHYMQLALSWAHENPVRRHYYDSGVNEGIGFYAEEMMLQAGLFDDSPRTREIIYNFMRLRALRVEVDVKLATGEFTIDEAARYLTDAVPMDAATAAEEAVFFAASPGQAISYQIGKIQITQFLSDARRMMGERFTLRHFHDFVWRNGNVPIALQRWEYLGLSDEVRQLTAR